MPNLKHEYVEVHGKIRWNGFGNKSKQCIAGELVFERVRMARCENLSWPSQTRGE